MVDLESHDGSGVKQKIKSAPDCYMCRRMNNHTNRLRCPRCGAPCNNN